jgi:uncharacterized membrane protein YbhN (UPF0104 family)
MAAAPSAERAAGPPPGRRRVRIAVALVTVALVAVIFAVVLPTIADYGAVWRVLRTLTWLQWLLLLGATALNIVTFAPPFAVALPGLGFVRALVLTQASTASTYVAPGGAAVGIALAYAMLRGWGFRTAQVTLAVAVTGTWNQFVLLGTPPAALVLLAASGGKHVAVDGVALIAFAVFVAAVTLFVVGLTSDGAARTVGDGAARVASLALRLVRRGPVAFGGETLVRFRLDAVGLLRRAWWQLTLTTLAGHLSVFLVFLACLRTLGADAGEIAFAEAFAAWSVARLLGSLPITPGGIGVVELGLTGTLIAFGGARAEIVAAVLLYRFLTVVPTLVLGVVAGTAWRRIAAR